MALTPEQKAAYEELDEAIRKVLATLPRWKEDGAELPHLVEWVVVAEGMRYDASGEEEECWHVISPSGRIRSSVGIGLMEIGKAMMEEPGED